ncbi:MULTISPECIES: hypothetical protein [Bacillus]|uniref:Uncharacterized protein n=4 Tax=Bacillus cereus group TaxID=86661 RepID=A0A2A7D1Y5_BACAN|nr:MULTISPECIES: hypothetical protein [Bacillus]PGU68324.1 hypothetical protein COD67_06985 [Bacillus cereus]EEM86403.1 hypothetical protein bthur0012_55970 [Bacillus thuringiensis serovar pulsiensis BGSC 4CC1]MCP1166803.1 hypothetical protein [Bacillus sp. 1813sda1]MDQ7237321.1 hypothetical protein [Bacillus pacificus]MDQ7239335.1 hypothetical protein [Bacillus pacificus]
MGLKMKTILRNIVSMALVLALFTTSFAGISKAQEINSEEEKLVQEVAAQLKFVVEEAAIKDKHGRVVDIDIDMIENKYGKTEELEQLRQEIQRVNTPPGYEDPFKQETEAVDNCIERKLIANYKEFLSVGFIGSIIANITNKEYELAARKMIRLGVKGNLIGLAGQLAWYLGTCIYEEEGWTGKTW